jgi:uncharacterized protein YdhG (YjbR/CyaY superfamily)
MPHADVATYLKAVPETFRPIVNAVRKIITASDKRLQERIKWNAPSYYFIEDLVTFGPIRKEKMVLVFHHPSVVKLNSPLLEGNYKDRRLYWFGSLKEIKSAEKELVKIIRFIISEIDKNKSAVALKTKGSLKTCQQGHSFYKSSDCPVCPTCEKLKNAKADVFSSLSAPARRALENEGITSLKKLSGYTLEKIVGLHGIGPSSIPLLKNLLSAERLKFKSK